MAWKFGGSWAVLVSGTAAGLSLILWSLRRASRQHQRRDMVQVLQEQRVRFQDKPQQAPVEEPAATVTEPSAGAGETDMAPAPRRLDKAEGKLFAVEAHMYELKAEAEELPAIQIRRRTQRGPVDEQLLLWPDADDPPVESDQPADVTAT